MSSVGSVAVPLSFTTAAPLPLVTMVMLPVEGPFGPKSSLARTAMLIGVFNGVEAASSLATGPLHAAALGSQGSNGFVPPDTSVPSSIPSPSVSGLVLSVPARISPSLLRPSKSQSLVPMALGFGSQASSGFDAEFTSSPSLSPSLSVSATAGSVP